MKQILTILFLLSFAFVNATIINVPTPYTTIQAGITAAANSDTVLVQPGTYVENIDYSGKNITVASLFLTTQDTTYIASTIIDGNSNGSVVLIQDVIGTAELTGFTLKHGSGTDYLGFGILSGGAILVTTCDDIRISNLIIKNNSAYLGSAIALWYVDPELENLLICNNTGQIGSVGFSYSDPVFINCTIVDNEAVENTGGIACGISANPVFINSILWNNDLYQLYYLDISSGETTISYSDVMNGQSGIFMNGQMLNWLDGNINSDPLFTSDYHLLADSPCIDTGDPASPLDPDETRVDMGVYYFNQYNGPIWHVSTTGSDLTGNGSLDFPFATIQHGIYTSADTETVLVQPGTYYENISYTGKLITLSSLFLTTQDTTYISSTIIDGNNSGVVVIFENNEDESALLTGFTITNGYTSSGGGIRCGYSDPSLENLIIKNNSVLNNGGGIHCGWSSPTIKNVVITNNSADMDGGGISTWYSHPVLTNVTISGNSADSEGGGIYCAWNSSFSFTNSILWGNTPEDIIIISTGVVSATYSDIPGVTGDGNFIANPLFTGDYHLSWANFPIPDATMSPCIDTGDPAHASDPDGTRADMGAFYFHHSNGLDPPQNVIIEIIGTDVHLSWDAVTEANSYKIHSSDDPITGFTEDMSGTFIGESWSASIGDMKKFYYVIAVN